MSEMIERVANALADADHGSEPGLPNYEAMARAAIEALREPTADMIYEGIGCVGFLESWRAMIDAALEKVDA